MEIQPVRSRYRLFFLIGITALYIARLHWLDFLTAPYWWDEWHFWDTTLTFSDKLVPSLADISDYEELSTPLPFVVFGSLEYLFGQGIVAGRLLNLLLSLAMIFIIGWPTNAKGGRAILCLIGLFLCPYYLILSGRLYTEMIACFWVLLGVVGYVHHRHGWSCVAFILAISARQYMLAFPVAIATYEFIDAAAHLRQSGSISWKAQWNWIAPSIAASSILFWVHLFGGLAPKSALIARADLVPDVQQTLLGIAPDGIIHFLAFIGLYVVVPEFFLFSPRETTKAIGQQWQHQQVKVGLITLGLLIFMALFPPQSLATGYVAKLASMMPHNLLSLGVYFFFALLTCIRFSKFSLVAVLIFFNALIMTKAHPWDRYALPMVVVFWYLKSLNLVDRYPLPALLNLKRSTPEPLASNL